MRATDMREYARLETSALLRRLAFQVNRTSKSADPDGIHDLRVAIRRLSRCLRVFSQFFPGNSWKKIRRQLATLLKAAGAVRDSDITLELLEKAGVPAGAAIVKRLGAERQTAAEALLKEVRRWGGRDFAHKWRGRLEL